MYNLSDTEVIERPQTSEDLHVNELVMPLVCDLQVRTNTHLVDHAAQGVNIASKSEDHQTPIFVRLDDVGQRKDLGGEPGEDAWR